MSQTRPNNFTNSKAAAVWVLRKTETGIKWFGSVSWRNPNDFNFGEFAPEKPIDQNKTSTFSFGPFGGKRESNQTILDCAYDETVQECGYFEIEDLRSKLETAAFICRDLDGKISTDYFEDKQYACITFFIYDNSDVDLVKKCSESSKREYERVTDSEFPNEIDLHKRKRSIESVIFAEVDLDSIKEKINQNILPVFDVSKNERIDPIGFPGAEKRIGKGLVLDEVPLSPLSAKTLKQLI